MTYRECAVVMAYTGTCMLTGDKLKHFYSYVSEILGEPVWTHELGIRADEIKEKSKPDFLHLCAEAHE